MSAMYGSGMAAVQRPPAASAASACNTVRGGTAGCKDETPPAGRWKLAFSPLQGGAGRPPGGAAVGGAGAGVLGPPVNYFSR